MINAIITYSVRHRWAVILAGVALAALGLWAAADTPVDAIPDLSENQVIAFTEWAGHGPREIEDQVTYPLTLGLRGLAGVRVVRSSSDVGFSMISVIFEDGVAPAEARRLVGERLARVQAGLPRGAVPALAPDAAATGQIFWYALQGGGLDLGRLRAIQDWYVRPQIGSVRGVAEVASVGGFPIEYEVVPDPDRLRLFRVTTNDVGEAIAASNAAAAGHVVHKGGAEYVVRGAGWLGASTTPGDDSSDPRRVLSDLENVVLDAPGGGTIRLAEVARVSIAPGFRRGVLEKDGNEVTGGVVLMARGENPLDLTRRIKAKIVELRSGLPTGVRIVPFYDRTPLIEGSIETVTGTVVEGMLSASLCVLLILLHVRTSLVIAAVLPLAALSSFLILALLRRSGILDVPANAMSLAGIAISIGVLVDSSVVMAENVMHRLREHYGSARVRGDVREVVLPACLAVGRPIVFSVVIMLLSFLPVFALGGIEGRMFHPLAYTKTFALAAVAVLAVTLVPALCTVFIRGRLRSEIENPLVRGVIEVYRPVLSYLLDRPAVMAWILGATFLLGFRAAGEPGGFPGTPGPGDDRHDNAGGDAPRGAAGACQPAGNRAGGRSIDDTAGAGIPDAAGRGHGHGHADHGPAGVGRGIRGRPEGARHGALPVPRGRHGRGQGGPRRDADRPRSPGHDRDHGQLPPPGVLAEAQAARRGRPAPCVRGARRDGRARRGRAVA